MSRADSSPTIMKTQNGSLLKNPAARKNSTESIDTTETDSIPGIKPAKYSNTVKYLGIKKCHRLLEDAEKHLKSGDSTTTSYLQNMTLYMLSQMDYVLRNKAIPESIYLGFSGTKENRSVMNLVKRFNETDNPEERQKILIEHADDMGAPYMIDSEFWESPPLRFSRKFRFKSLLFEESHSWIWNIWDRIQPDKCKLEGIFQTLNSSSCFTNSDGLSSTLDELMKLLTWEAAKHPKIKGLLWIGSSAGKPLKLQDMVGREVDIVIFISGLYFKRAIVNLHGIEFDVLGVPIWLAKYGISRYDPMTVDCLTHGKILLDSRNKLEELKTRACELWKSGPPEINAYDIYKSVAEIEKYIEHSGHAAQSDQPTWRLIVISAFEAMIRLTVRMHRVWLKSEQDCIKMLEEIDPGGCSWLIKILRTNSGVESSDHLRNWYNQSIAQSIKT